MMRSTSGRKPMSSMRSASSRTRIWTFLSETAPRSMRSSRRPGVATRICARRASFACLCDAGAAVDGRDREVADRWRSAGALRDLKRELARGGDDERRAGRRFQAKLLDDGSGEGERLARAGGRLDEDVEAGECVADHELLDCKRFCDASLGEGIANGRGHAEVREGLVRHIGAAFFRDSWEPRCDSGDIRTGDPNRTRCAPELNETSRVRLTRTRRSVAVWLQVGALCRAEVAAADELRGDQLGPVLFGEDERLRLREPAAEDFGEAAGSSRFGKCAARGRVSMRECGISA